MSGPLHHRVAVSHRATYKSHDAPYSMECGYRVLRVISPSPEPCDSQPHTACSARLCPSRKSFETSGVFMQRLSRKICAYKWPACSSRLKTS